MYSMFIRIGTLEIIGDRLDLEVVKEIDPSVKVLKLSFSTCEISLDFLTKFPLLESLSVNIDNAVLSREIVELPLKYLQFTGKVGEIEDHLEANQTLEYIYIPQSPSPTNFIEKRNRKEKRRLSKLFVTFTNIIIKRRYQRLWL